MNEALFKNAILDSLDPTQILRKAGFVPDEWQSDVLRSLDKRILLNCSRQSGKSLTAAAAALHTSVYVPGSLTLLISVAQRQSTELFRVCRQLQLDSNVTADEVPTTESLQRLELQNGSRILSLPGQDPDTIRGFSSANLVVIDEAARTTDALYAALRPMVAVSGGRLICLSTPAGKRGWWYNAWISDSQEWLRVQVRADQCPRISAQFLEEERESLGDALFSQEYECSFLSDEYDVFSMGDFDKLLTDEPALEV